MTAWRRRLLIALAVSTAAHVAMLGVPGWRPPLLDDAAPSDDALLDARLVVARAAREPARRAHMPPRPPAPRSMRPRAAPPATEDAGAQAVAAEGPGMVVPGPTPRGTGEGPVAQVDERLPAVSWPARGRLRYAVTRGDQGLVVGRAEHVWQHDGASYVLIARAETTGLAALFRPAQIVQRSEGQLLAGRIRPALFTVERNGVLGEAVNFDWPAGRVVFGGGREAATEAGMQDMLSVFHALAQMPLEGGRAVVSVATGKKVERYAFVAIGEEMVDTPVGSLRALRLRADGPAPEATEVWLALERGRLPVRIRHVDRKGDSYDQSVDAWELEEGTRSDAHQ